MNVKTATVSRIEKTGEFVVMLKEEETIKRVSHLNSWDDAQAVMLVWITS